MAIDTETTTDLDAIRSETDALLRANLPADFLKAAEEGDQKVIMKYMMDGSMTDFLKPAGQAGLYCPTWPKEYGGRGYSPQQALAVEEAFSNLGVPIFGDFVGRMLAGPTIMQWGTDAQKDRYLNGLAKVEDRWCQLFSEPGAGSDLAGLATRAVKDGDAYIVNGQKVWSSGADNSDLGLLLARTDPDQPKHRGISYFILDMKSEGVEVRPLTQMTGGSSFCEVFFTDVVVPAENMLGPENDGWRVTNTTLMNERSGLSGKPEVTTGPADGLVASAKKHGQWEDAAVRQEITDLWIQEKILMMVNERAAVNGEAGNPGPEGSITKLAGSELGKKIVGMRTALRGPGGVAWVEGDESAQEASYALLQSPSSSILGGTSEIQRNIIGERVLGLARDISVDKDIAWKDVPRSG